MGEVLTQTQALQKRPWVGVEGGPGSTQLRWLLHYFGFGREDKVQVQEAPRAEWMVEHQMDSLSSIPVNPFPAGPTVSLPPAPTGPMWAVCALDMALKDRGGLRE